MTEQLLTMPPLPSPPDDNSNFCEEFDALPIPPLDPLFFSAADPSSAEALTSDPAFCFDENGGFEINFDDLDNLYFPSENESFFIPNLAEDQSPNGCSGDFTPNNAIPGDQGSDVVDKYLNCWSSESGSCDRGNAKEESSQDLGDAGSSSFDSPASSSLGSGVSEGMHASSANSGNIGLNQKVKLEETGKLSVAKRKKENEDANGESRTSKYHRSSVLSENPDASGLTAGTSEEEEKRKARLMRNRESAQLSRQRKKHYVEELEDKVRNMHSTIVELNGKISYFMAENATLRQQLTGGAGICPPPPIPGVYPAMAPIPYPWVPCAPYVVKPQGSQVPLVPIPRLKPQQSLSTSKVKKSESKKSMVKTKKVASISFLGLFFFIVLFGGLVPLINVKYGGTNNSVGSGSSYVSDWFYDQHSGRVIVANGHYNGTDGSDPIGFSGGHFDIRGRIHCERGPGYGAYPKGGPGTMPGSEKVVPVGNSSEPLVASLFVPRNDKLVKIDGNLIIHSVLASEKAMASHKAPETKNNRETSLAIPRDFSPALAIPDVRRNGGIHSHLYRSTNERQKALSSGSADTLEDHFKSSAADGKLQQWFREGVAGPMLSSGMCTEVFQFNVSPASIPGAIIPASSVANISQEHSHNVTNLNKGRNRRILHGLPVPLTGSDLNFTEEHVGRSSQKDNFQGNKSASSMVVSVLVDPREAGDADIDGMIRQKSLSRIFVVVLLDSVKYVTYSCVLPHSGLHLVTT